MEKLLKKARRGKLVPEQKKNGKMTRRAVADQLLNLAAYSQSQGWSAEDLLRALVPT